MAWTPDQMKATIDQVFECMAVLILLYYLFLKD